MDDDYVRAVMTFFVRLWDRGWIYRANRIVNWCPFHQTAISDLEVVHEEMDDTLYTIRYPFADGDGRDGVSVATVRPATILADVGVAVHPDDPRYREAVGREVIVPYTEQRVPVIADERIDREFGTGALKVTPGHDPLDFDIGRDHGLPEPIVVGPDGRMNEQAGDLAGLTQEEAGARVVAWAEERGLVEARAIPALRRHVRALPLPHRAAHLAAVVVRDDGARAARDRGAPGATRPLPPRVAAPVRDRVPRGGARLVHLAPALVGSSAADLDVPRQAPDRDRRRAVGLRRVRSTPLERESDVLDTWFSSALWPYATLGWPDETPELARYYPGTSTRPRGEIIRLWENRMIWTGLEVLGEVPFTDVDHPLDGPRARRPADVEEPRHRHRPDGADRGVRSRRDALRAPQDLLDAGRALLVRGDRGGAQARDQALERRAPDPPERRGRRARARAARPRGALDPRALDAAAPGSRTPGRASTSPSRRRRSTTSRSTTSATGTRRRSSRGSTTAIRRRSRPRSRRSSASSRSSIR